MKRAEAEEIYYIKKEIERLKKDLDELRKERNYYNATMLTDKAGRHKNLADDYLTREEKLEKLIIKSLRRQQEKVYEFEKILQGVDDAEMRLILRMRCINNSSWEEIGARLGMDRRTASRKFNAYFAGEKIAHNARSGDTIM